MSKFTKMNEPNSLTRQGILVKIKLDETTPNKSLISRLEEFERLLHLTLPKIEREGLWISPNAQIPCLGVQLAHMEGNLRQYIVTNLSHQNDLRQRTLEFTVRPEISLQQLSTNLLEALAQAKNIIKQAPSRVWSEVYHVQTFSMTRLEACIHALEHLHYHLGQMALLIKLNRPQDLAFYPEIN